MFFTRHKEAPVLAQDQAGALRANKNAGLLARLAVRAAERTVLGDEIAQRRRTHDDRRQRRHRSRLNEEPPR